MIVKDKCQLHLYSNIQKGIEEDKHYLKKFFENILLGKENELSIEKQEG